MLPNIGRYNRRPSQRRPFTASALERRFAGLMLGHRLSYVADGVSGERRTIQHGRWTAPAGLEESTLEKR